MTCRMRILIVALIALGGLWPLQRVLHGQSIVWIRQFGSAGGETSFALAVGGGKVAVAGNVTAALPSQTLAGGEDAFVRVYDTNGVEQWTRQFGTGANDAALRVAIAASGYIYVSGHTFGALDGPSAGDLDAFLRKYDADGNLVWARQFGTSSTDDGHGGLTVDILGDIYVAGRTRGALAGASAGGYDAYIRKYDVNGNVLWTRQFGSSDDDGPGRPGVDIAGNLLVPGETSGALAGANAGSRDAFLRKYDAAGSVLWTRQFGTAGDDGAGGAAMDGTNAVVIGSTQGSFSGFSNSGGWDVFLRKYDTSGGIVWTRQFGTAADEHASVAVDSVGNIFAAGGTAGALPGQTLAGPGDVFVRAYDAAGLEKWTYQFGTAATDGNTQGAVDATGALYVFANTWGAFPGFTLAGPVDVFLAKLATAAPAKLDQTITFGTLSNKTFGDANFTVSATASSGLAVSFAASGNCTVSSATVSLTGAGSCTITASQPGNANYNPAPDLAQTFTIAKANQTIGGQVYDAFADFSIASNPTLGGAWRYGYKETLTEPLTLYDNNQITNFGLSHWTSPIGIDPNVVKNETGQVIEAIGAIRLPVTDFLHFHPGPSGQFSVVRWTAPAAGNYDISATFKSLRFAGSATSSTVHVLRNTTQIFSAPIIGYISNTEQYFSTLLTLNAGETIDFAVGMGSGGYTSDSTGVNASITPASNAIPFGPLSNKTFGDPNFTVSATASSGLAVIFSAAGNCTASGNSVSLTGAGSCTITASQPGNANYNAAPDVSQTFAIAKANQTITFAALANKTFGDPNVAVNATATSGLAVSFAASGSCTVSGTTVSLTAVGSCTVTASQPGNANYNVAPNVAQTFTIAKANQTITFAALADKTDKDSPFSVGATATSGLTVSFTAGGNCTISGATVTLSSVGTCTVTASQAGNANYNAAPSVARAFAIRDTTPPVVTILTPTVDTLFLSSPFTAQVQASDAVGVASVNINGVAAVLSSGTPKSGTWLASINVSLTTATTFTVTAIDGAANAAPAALTVDNDGIAAAIDKNLSTGAEERTTYSSQYAKNASTRGTIVTRGGWVVRIDDLAGAPVRASLASSSGNGMAQVSACAGSRYKEIRLDAAGEAADWQCDAAGTLSVKAVQASPTIEIYKFGCGSFGRCSVRFAAALRTGQSFSTGSPFTADPNNTEPIVIQILDEQDVAFGSFTLDPGASVAVDVSDGPNGETRLTVTVLSSTNGVAVTVSGITRTLTQGGGSQQFVQDKLPPVIGTVANVTAEATSAAGATVTFSAPAITDDADPAPKVSFAPASGSVFPLGTTPVTVTATDAAGRSASKSFTVTVRDTAAPAITGAAVDKQTLWPANHRMVDVSVNYTATDAVDSAPACGLSVASNEPINGTGDGDMSSDWNVIDARRLQLRAERAGTGNGRVYTITLTCRDASNNAASQTLLVRVPKSQ